MIWFTADTHFGHAAILRMQPKTRPFASIEEHDAALVKAWNDRVGPRDTVYHLGDFSLGSRANAWEVRGALQGRIILVLGNHDEGLTPPLLATFERTADMLHHRIPGLGVGRVAMLHYPMRSWRSCWAGSVHLHGHSHNHEPVRREGLPDVPGEVRMELWRRRIDVGVDAWGLRPVSADELIELVNGVVE